MNERKGDTKSVVGRTAARMVADQTRKMVHKRRRRPKSGAKTNKGPRGKYTPRMKTNRRTDESDVAALVADLIEGRFKRSFGRRKGRFKGKVSGKQRIAVLLKLKNQALRFRKISAGTLVGATRVKKALVRKTVGKARKPTRIKTNVRRRVIRKAGLEKRIARHARHGVRTPFGAQ